jgi:hypothetical protein
MRLNIKTLYKKLNTKKQPYEIKNTNKKGVHEMSTLQKAQELNNASRKHKEQGNTKLATWLKASAEHFKKVYEDTNRTLDRMALGNYETSSTSSRYEFTKQWYDYEEEYAYNFCGLE